MTTSVPSTSATIPLSAAEFDQPVATTQGLGRRISPRRGNKSPPPSPRESSRSGKTCRLVASRRLRAYEPPLLRMRVVGSRPSSKAQSEQRLVGTTPQSSLNPHGNGADASSVSPQSRKAIAMRVFGFISAHSLKKRPRLIAPKLLSSAVTVALFATVVAVGGSAAATTTGSPRASISSSSATAISTAATKYYLQQSGKGNKVLRSVALPSKWYLTWRFDCGTKKGDFVLTSTRKGQSSLTVTRQGPGLGGGGQQPYKKAGTYKFAVKTTCSWTVSASASPPGAAK
jgi:hypothetical protein